MWIFFSILAALLWSIVNVIDKTIMTKYVRQPIVFVIIMGLISIVFSAVILINNFVLISGLFLALSLLAGILYALATIFYFKALQIEEASRVVPLFSLTIVWTTIIAILFLDEFLVLEQYLGILLIFIGSFLISSRKKTKLRISKALSLALLSSFLYSIHNILIKFLVKDIDYWTVFSYSRMGMFLIAIPLLIYHFEKIKSLVKEFKIKVIGIMASSESLSLLGDLSFTVATSLGLISLVNTTTAASNYIFIFLWMIVLSIWFPKILKEELKGSTIFLKLVSIILIIGGLILII